MFFISSVIIVCLVGLARCQGTAVDDPIYSHCQDITIPMCLELPYTKTVYPNLMGHTSQDEASVEIYQYFPLIKVNCSADIQVSLSPYPLSKYWVVVQCYKESCGEEIPGQKNEHFSCIGTLLIH